MEGTESLSAPVKTSEFVDDDYRRLKTDAFIYQRNQSFAGVDIWKGITLTRVSL